MERQVKTKMLGASILVLRIWIIVDMCFIVTLLQALKMTTTF